MKPNKVILKRKNNWICKINMNQNLKYPKKVEAETNLSDPYKTKTL